MKMMMMTIISISISLITRALQVGIRVCFPPLLSPAPRPRHSLTLSSEWMAFNQILAPPQLLDGDCCAPSNSRPGRVLCREMGWRLEENARSDWGLRCETRIAVNLYV